jgi:hypothetical protein
MLTVLLLLSKYRLRNVPVVEPDKPVIRNFITQAGVVKGLQQCRGRDWFDYISALPLADVGLPFMSMDEVISPPFYSYRSLPVCYYILVILVQELMCYYILVIFHLLTAM